MKKHILAAILAVSFLGCKPAHKITPGEAANRLGPNPHFIIDGQASEKAVMQTMDAEDVALVAAFYGKDATSLKIFIGVKKSLIKNKVTQSIIPPRVKYPG